MLSFAQHAFNRLWVTCGIYPYRFAHICCFIFPCSFSLSKIWYFALEWFALIDRENILLDVTVVSVRQHDVNVLFDGIWTSWDTLHTGDRWVAINKLRPRQNGRHFADDISKYIFLYENARISLKISLKFVPNVRINNIPALAQIMAWRRPGDKPLSEPMVVSLLTHICATRPQWVNRMRCGDAYMPQRICTVIVLASNGDKPLPSE